MSQKSVGDFLGRMQAPKMPDAGVRDPSKVGAPPIDVEEIKKNAGASKEVEERAKPPIEPLLMKEIEVIQLKLKLAETEEELLVHRVQEVRRRRAELLHLQKQLVTRAKGQVVVGPNGDPQPAPQ